MAKSKVKSSDVFDLGVKDEVLCLTPLLPLTLKNAAEYDKYLDVDKITSKSDRIVLDMARVKIYDSFLVIFLKSLKESCKEKNTILEEKGISDRMESFISALTPSVDSQEPERPRAGFFHHWVSNIGIAFKLILKDTKSFIEFFGLLLLKFMNLLIRPWDMRWKDFPFHFLRSGVNALPISFLIVFLIGIITGYQGALQLAQFGADIYIADLIGISITRELAPLMTAILVAGRSGSAFAAEIGTMKVSEEIDALDSMGFDPIKFLVLPRVASVMIAMPILVIFADIAGIGGGLIAALGTLDITLTGYLNELNRALSYWDLFTGLGKSVVFGFLIATVGCFRGLQVKGGAESVGRFTTASVVSGVLLIILSDAVFTFIFQVIGI